jgi:hypothetical protein
MSISPISYAASGGESQLRPYGEGEELRVELHRRSFSILWTARESSPAEFMHRIGALVALPDAGRATLAPADDEGQYHFLEAVSRLEDGSLSADFIRVAFPDGVFTWRAPDEDAASKWSPVATGEVGVMWNRRSQLRPDWLRSLIDATATPQVKDDVERILESTEQLTSDFKPVAA